MGSDITPDSHKMMGFKLAASLLVLLPIALASPVAEAEAAPVAEAEADADAEADAW